LHRRPRQGTVMVSGLSGKSDHQAKWNKVVQLNWTQPRQYTDPRRGAGPGPTLQDTEDGQNCTATAWPGRATSSGLGSSPFPQRNLVTFWYVPVLNIADHRSVPAKTVTRHRKYIVRGNLKGILSFNGQKANWQILSRIKAPPANGPPKKTNTNSCSTQHATHGLSTGLE